jgi:hypothetical protein
VTGIRADCIGVSKRKESLDHRSALMDLRQKELDRIPKEKRTTDDEIRWGNAKGDLACAHMERGRYDKAKYILKELLGWNRKWDS